MGTLKEYANKHSMFINFDEGVIEGRYNGAKIILKESFGEEKEAVRYKIDEKVFDSLSSSLALQMDEIELGTKIKITKTGEGMKTKYVVERL